MEASRFKFHLVGGLDPVIVHLPTAVHWLRGSFCSRAPIGLCDRWRVHPLQNGLCSNFSLFVVTAAGIFCGICAAAMVALLMWGGWSRSEEHSIVIILGWALGGLIAAMIVVIVGLLAGGPVGRFKVAASRDGASIEAAGHDGEATTDRGGGGKPSMHGLSPTAGRSSQGSGQDGLPDRLLATEQAIQLDELIKWVKRQSANDPNGAAESR